MRGFFVTGTDTGIGKTRVTAGLLKAFASTRGKTVGMKPVASGASVTREGLRNDDALALQAAASEQRLYALVNPYCFAPPVAPHLAAMDAGVEINLETIVAAYGELCTGADTVLVEGVGGWQLPLSPTLELPDLVRELDLPVILVVGMRLGCINHRPGHPGRRPRTRRLGRERHRSCLRAARGQHRHPGSGAACAAPGPFALCAIRVPGCSGGGLAARVQTAPVSRAKNRKSPGKTWGYAAAPLRRAGAMR